MDKEGVVTINGNLTKLPIIEANREQPVAENELTSWFLKNAEIHTGSSKIFEAKSKEVCGAVIYIDLQPRTVIYRYLQWNN